MKQVTEIRPLGKPLPEAVETLKEWMRLRDLGRQRKREFEEAQWKLNSRVEIERKDAA